MFKKLIIMFLISVLNFSCASRDTRPMGGSTSSEALNKNITVADYEPAKEKRPAPLTYEQLITENFDSDQETLYTGSFYPIRVFYETKRFHHPKINGQKILMLSTDEPEKRLLMLFPDDKIDSMRELTQNFEKKGFIYKPLGMAREKYPLIQFIEMADTDIKETE